MFIKHVWTNFFLCLLSMAFSLLTFADVSAFEIKNLGDPSAYTLSDGSLILSGTNRKQQKINSPVFIGSNLRKLDSSSVSDALPILPLWSSDSVWGSEITQVNDGYALYFAAHNKERNMRCIGVAKSKVAIGPYKPVGNSPLLCPTNIKEVLSPAIFHETDGTIYLLYKQNSGHGGNHPNTAIFIVQLDESGTHIIGTPAAILHADRGWERKNIESPTLIKEKGYYYLFYSGSYFKDSSYSVGYATSKLIYGPYNKPIDNSILKTADGKYAPGSQGITRDKCGNYLLFYHSFLNNHLNPPRNTYVKKINFNRGVVELFEIDNDDICNVK